MMVVRVPLPDFGMMVSDCQGEIELLNFRGCSTSLGCVNFHTSRVEKTHESQGKKKGIFMGGKFA